MGRDAKKRAYYKMSQPKIVYWSWGRAIPQLIAGIVLSVLCTVFFFLQSEHLNFLVVVRGMTYGSGLYLVYSFGSRKFIPRHHQEGVRLFAEEKCEEAIDCFEDSLRFFQRHPWIDTYRSVVLMTSSVFTYREMALMNIASANVNLGKLDVAEEQLLKIIEEFPQNIVAKNTLKFFAKSQD